MDSSEIAALVVAVLATLGGFVAWMSKISSDTGRTLQKIDGLMDGHKTVIKTQQDHENRITTLEIQMEGP